MHSLTVLIPAYNEELLIKKTTLSIFNYLKKIKIDFEIIACVNSSTDRTEAIVKSLSKKYKQIRYASIKEKGFGIALWKGIATAKKELITYMPADGEVDNSFIRDALKYIDKYDIVFGVRYLTDEYKLENLFREFLSRAYAKIIKIIFCWEINEFGNLKMFRADWAKRLLKECESRGFDFQVEMLYFALRDKKSIKEIQIEFTNQKERKSTVKVFETIILLSRIAIKYGLKWRLHQIKQLFH